MIHMEYYLVVSTIMMFAGIYGFFTRRNTLAILISVELMLNATDINFAVFNRFLFPGGMEGYFFALFSIAISAAETAIAIAIMIKRIVPEHLDMQFATHALSSSTENGCSDLPSRTLPTSQKV